MRYKPLVVYRTTKRRSPLLDRLDRRGAEHVKRCREATIECEAGWWIKIDENCSRP
jgi:hypothetical protein